ncbi:MAG TPA: methyl-accepting chemotaxis protein, partial [Phycisphaerae bacterium]|nr:methyl-accepting chemotaxis protein [Phycisphaerae bacterium]
RDHAAIRAVSDADAKWHRDWLTRYKEAYGYSDLYLIAHSGQVLYSANGGKDLDKNVVNGDLQDTPLARCFASAMEKVTFEDFSPYAPVDGKPRAFVGAPIRFEGAAIGTVILQMDGSQLAAVMSEHTGMGESGATFLVGPGANGATLRSPHSIKGQIQPIGAPITGAAIDAALKGKDAAGQGIFTDSDGKAAVTSYARIDAAGRPWALIGRVDADEALAAVNTMQQTGAAASQALVRWIGIIAVIAAVGVTLVSVLVARSITRPILRIMRGLDEGADQVDCAAEQVSQASQQLAHGASDQASALEESSAALEELAAQTRGNADHARSANELTTKAQAAAGAGDQTVKQLCVAMEAINDSSGQISSIIKAIEEIAFQTNLLALNAAVEAARAGEHGKGFAVVADEVRRLAQRAGEAAGQSAGLIENSVGKAKEGVEVTRAVEAALAGIIGDVGGITKIIGNIANSSAEQSRGVGQINEAVRSLDSVTQQNAASAEESASASEQLAAQAQVVKSLVQDLTRLVGAQ